jgi:hypothetical protein
MELKMAKGKRNQPILERLLEKIIENPINGCWEWTAGTNNIGYGMIKSEHDNRKMRTAHRAMYEVYNGPIPYGMQILHKCSNVKCINPDHLFMGTYKDRMDYMKEQNRAKFWGHDPEGKRIAPTKTCPHCGKTMANNMYSRWHGDNCRHKSKA